MDIWRRLRSEPPKIRAAIVRRDRRKLAAAVRRIALALATLDGEPVRLDPVRADAGRVDPARFERLAKLAPEYGVTPKTLGRWIDRDLPGALVKRPRLTLVDKQLYAEWTARFQKRASGGRG